MQSGPFNGNGIPANLDISKSKISKDPYYSLLEKKLQSHNLFNNTKNQTKELQQSLLYPYSPV